MAFSYACLVLQRVVLPAVLVLASLMRPVGISFVYMLMFFMSPFVPLATRRNFKGSVTAFFIILLALSTLVLLGHIALQVLALSTALPIYNCSFSERLLRHIGFVSFVDLRPLAIIEWLAPEVLVLATSLGAFLSVKRLALQNINAEQLENGELPDSQSEQQVSSQQDANGSDVQQATATTPLQHQQQQLRKRVSMISQHIHFEGLIKISPLFCLATLFFAAVLRPSVPGGFYFLIFLLAGTYWATCQTLQRGFALLLRCVMFVLVLHSLCIVSYQTPWMQSHLNHTSLAARLIGLEPLIESDCVPDIRILLYNNRLSLDSYLNPFALFFAYFALALTTKHLIKPRLEPKPATAFGQTLECNNSSNINNASSNSNIINNSNSNNTGNRFNRQLSLLTSQTTRSGGIGGVSVSGSGGHRKDSSGVGVGVGVNATVAVGVGGATTSRTQRLSVSLRREQRATLNEPTETTPLVRQSTRKARTPQALESTTAAATTAPSGSRGNDIQLDTIERRSEQENNTTSILDQISYGFVSVGGFIYQNSYIFTNILMMAWSIVYHSWLTFVLLLWANVLWMIPNQRKAMMRSSPFIVLYAELLLVAQYIYGMDLNNNELPTRVSTAGINLQQIGFERPIENHMRPCVPLIVKTAFVLMFWVTSRQFFKEKRDRRRDSTLADIIAPLQITVGSAGSSYLINDGKKTSKFLKKAGDVIKNLLVRLWIWLLVLVIFLCAITGDDMTGFRICYMALFLFFLLVFQSSSKAWVKIMYGFWLFLIFYAMSILILIYTYQFDKFDMYWKDYLNVSQTLQADIGLKLYKTKDLFLHLVSPTIIVILTVIQVHYFHKRFIASLQQQPTTPGTRSQLTAANAQQKRTETAALEAAPSKRRGSASSIRQRSTEAAGTAAGATTTDFETSVRDLVRISFRKIKNKSEYIFKRFKTVFWRFLELHIMKAVYIAAFVCSVSEVCVLHIIFVGFCVLGATSRKAVQVVISRLISFIVTIIVLSKMIYQIEYLDHNQYSVTCSDNRTANNAEWIGLNKADKLEGGLMGLLRTYIIYMVIVTMHAVISLRQLQMRVKIGENVANQPKLLFQQITRADAEKDLVGLVKYLLNFGFYKFGIEISLIALVSTITYRQDIVAVVYAVWLVVLLLLKRSQCAKMWGVFQAFFAISILLQYIVLVGLPPSWCMSYPWDDGAFGESIQRWTMLPGQLHFNHVPKLIFDFIVLIILNRQKSIFCIEQRYATNDDYPGGSNRSVIADIAQLGRVPFDNPTHDFCSYIRNYSDILKNGVLCGFYWFTLAVVFLAGTNIADLLALGYLIGAFVFLWQGSDFYLRPIATIISRWKWLLAFNVANILIKTSFQMAGCLFMTPLTTHCCWLVHMLGITCTSNVIKEQLHVADEAEVLTDSTGCPKMTHQVVLLWDAICFAFIIFQLRIFQSHYFCHIITDTKANNILASRGADIIESLRQKQIAHRHDHEKQVLHKIKRKMERIRATQQKMLRPLDKQTHFDELPAPTVRRRKDIKLHPHATRAGDYYMFEEMDDKFELDLIHDEIDFMEEENITESEMKMQRRKTLYDKSKDAPTDFFPSTSKGVSKERDAAASSMSSPKPTKDLTDLPSTPALTTVPREATSKETSDSKSKMELDSGDVTAKDSDEDFDTNPIIRLLEGFLVTLTIRLNRFSRNYRFVNRILAGEKKTLKESSSLNRLGLSSAAAMFHFLKSNLERKQSISSSPPTKGAGEFNLEEENFAQRDHHIIVEVLISSWYALLANTDLICYIVVFINQVVNASLISLPLPIMVFLWGTLSLPRPTKTFWVTLIAYTQAIVLIKCIFQFKLIWSNYNNLPNQPLAPAKIFGVEMKTHYAVYDLILLLVLFLHRYLLKSQGLWKSGYKDVDQQFTKPTASIDEREDSDNLSQPDSRQLNEDAAQKMSLQVSQVSLPGSPEYSKSAINQLERTKYTSSLHKFFFSLVHKSRLATDVYALMFLCDFINFFVLLFGFTAFGTQQTESDGGVQTYLAENKVPVPFLIMLLVQFLLIVIDRALYLRKALVNKIIFHFFSVIGIHIWMFFVVPAVTERTFNSLAPPIIFYVIKCFYMLLSSYQIKSGYPKRILGNFFTKGFSMVNMIAFKVYMQIPFLYELRTILDWVCIDSTMTIFDWLKMEDIFSNIYLIRCTRQSETDFPAMRAQKKASLSKLIMGGTVVLLIVICIWGPLCLFALGNAVGSSNVPYQVSLSIRIGPYDPIYTTNNYDSIFEIDSKMYTQMTNAFFKNKQALTFIAGYDATDVAAVKLAGNSPSLWNIAPPDKQRLTNDLRNNHTLIARFSYSLTRKAPAKGLKENVGDEHVIKLDETFEGRAALINMLNETLDPIETNENGTTNGNNTTPASSSADDVVVVLPNMIPKFIKVLNSGDAFVATVMSGKEQEYRPLVIKLHRDKATKAMWWEIRDYCYDSFYNNTLKDLAYSDCKSGIVMYTFNDKKFPSTFSFLTAGGIIGLYTTFVLLASRFMKSFIGGQNRKIMFEDLPYVDRVLQLCLDIYLVREALEFALEEDLFAKLLFLYRSPETLIKWTRPKEEYLDDDGDTDSIPSRMSVRRPEQLQQHQYQQQQQQQQQ
ncbi:piezo-type mechanosensitive ion channel component isoform X8 [Drosophila sulfurigaster albostrigata]|uniref:piezo-type mechanosensitive ion channel component isoform X8 n=1 Tax=Drosophila sulfurigaster albostrigata TaxID=89887 RepID=UPI002D2199CA|nr:piezo-type mechanosensitive ion channel component isoform X8 [Drosophila sulfurigaster albostrigata]